VRAVPQRARPFRVRTLPSLRPLETLELLEPVEAPPAPGSAVSLRVDVFLEQPSQGALPKPEFAAPELRAPPVQPVQAAAALSSRRYPLVPADASATRPRSRAPQRLLPL
jgi:hypothetical protein